MPDDLEVVPLHVLLSIHKQGGVLLGAFDGEELVGFVFGFLGRTGAGDLKHCSHMMGVTPGYQGAGIGYRLKLAQRDRALAQGLDLVTWTYDPLQSRNAYLNIHKLGAVCRTYIPDYYGPMADGLNAGLPSDRFQVEWWLASERVTRCLDGDAADRNRRSTEAVLVNRAAGAENGLPAPGDLSLDCRAGTLRVQTPADYGAIKAADPDLALEWRLAMRAVFEHYFGAGYVATGFWRDDRGLCSYQLSAISSQQPEG
jgi:predicted GNAT superfamily acetyltransferase